MKRPFMVWIGFISIRCSKVANEGKSCPRLLVLQKVARKLPSTIYLCLGDGENPKKNHARENAQKKFVQIKGEDKEKNSCRRKVPIKRQAPKNTCHFTLDEISFFDEIYQGGC